MLIVGVEAVDRGLHQRTTGDLIQSDCVESRMGVEAIRWERGSMGGDDGVQISQVVAWGFRHSQ